MDWDKVTDIMVIISIIAIGIFGIIGLYQWFTRKSFQKIDKPIIALIVPLALVVVTWLIFDHFWILNTRPDGSGEPSFPSTHTMITATSLFCVAILLPHYLKNKSLIALLDFLMLIIIVLVPVGRVLANKHWISDVIGGLVFSLIFATIYFVLVKKFTKKEKHE